MSRFFYAKFRSEIAIEGIETFAEINSPDLMQVESLPKDFLFKKYNNGAWEDAPAIRAARIDSEGIVIDILTTFWDEDVPNDCVVVTDGVDVNWRLVDGQWVEPELGVTDGSN